MILATTPSHNEKNGNGKYSSLRKRKKQGKEGKKAEFSYLSSNDMRMRFNNAQDPIYFVFDCIDNRSLTQVVGEFVKDTFFEVTNFVSKVAR